LPVKVGTTLGPASIAGEPLSSAMVLVGPPLSANESSNGEVEVTLFEPLTVSGLPTSPSSESSAVIEPEPGP
jgi:hypothetical protein